MRRRERMTKLPHMRVGRTLVGAQSRWRIVALTSLLVAANAPSAAAQVAVSPALAPERQQAEEAKNQPTRLQLYPASNSDPLLKHRLWPAPHDQIDENAWPLVSRAILMSVQVDRDARNRFKELYSEWATAPLDELPVEAVREGIRPFESAIRELRRAENLMGTDYGLRLRELSAGQMVSTLLPEFQEARTLARVLDLRARVAIAEGRWDEAIADLRLGFRLSEIVGHGGDFLVCRLIGYAISGLMMQTIEQAVQHPDCPNLYWPLANLPAERLFEIRDSLQFESVVLTRVFGLIGDLPEEPIGAAAARAKIKQISDHADELLNELNESGMPTDLLSGVYVVMFADVSRDTLAETPQWKDRVDELSASEAVLRATVLKMERIRDRWLAWSTLPSHMWKGYEPTLEKALEPEIQQADVVTVLARLLTPAVEAAMRASLRGEQQRNLLATIEAIRLHAAETGEFPESLESVKPVPVFVDPMAHGPFQYTRTSKTEATLKRAQRYPDDEKTTFQLELKGDQ